MGEYKIKDIETLTGIKSHTIRIWEKRYNILNPERTDTKIRTYSDADLMEILNIAILNKNGWKISHIAQLPSKERKAKVLAIQSSDKEDTYYEKLLLSMIEMDENSFQSTLNHLIKDHGLENTYTKYLIPFLKRIGIMWVIGTINPGQEHFISLLIRQRIISETAKLPIPDKDAEKVLLFLPELEWHELSLLLYHFVLRNKGVHSIYLGQSLPYKSLLECIDVLNPKAVLTSVLTAREENFYEELFQKMRSDLGDLMIYVGGHQAMQSKSEISKYATIIETLKDIEPLYFIT